MDSQPREANIRQEIFCPSEFVELFVPINLIRFFKFDKK